MNRNQTRLELNDAKELNEEKIIDHALHLHYRPFGVGAQQTKDTKGTHHGGFLPVPLTGSGLVDIDATAGGV